MTTTALLLQELDLESLFTRRHLERVPMDKADFKPHEKSMTLGWLATFIAILPAWGERSLSQSEVDLTGPRPAEHTRVATSHADLLALFDSNVAAMREALTRTTDSQLDDIWSLKAGAQTLFAEPRGLVYRAFIMNHLVHHRAQLGVYLRMLGIAVPAVYSDSADEKGGMFMRESAAVRPSSG
jgi:hypothetical protein